MDIYAKYPYSEEQKVNANILNNRPFFMTKEEVDEMDYYRKIYGVDCVCWESNIIDQIKENKYGWFDFSKSMIDIGAGAGEYPIFAGFAHSYAFDPNRRKQCLMYMNILSFDMMDKIDVLPYAVGENHEMKDFNGWTEDLTNTTRCVEPVHKVEFRTLDSFDFKNIGLIKADIEGFELYALRSGIGTIIRNNFPPLLIEIWPEADIKSHMKEQAPVYIERRNELLKLLAGLGYTFIPDLGDWETKFFIHKTQLNGYEVK